jgi:hypothetical protein
MAFPLPGSNFNDLYSNVWTSTQIESFPTFIWYYALQVLAALNLYRFILMTESAGKNIVAYNFS